MDVALSFNCGFARAAVRELTPTRRGCKAREIDTTARATEFAKLFSFRLPDGYFEKQGTNPARFNVHVHCEQTLNAFSSHWRPKTARADYLEAFSIVQWKALPSEEAAKHTLAKCDACAIKYNSLQEYFPLKPTHRVPDNLQELYESTEASNGVENEACMARVVLSSVNEQHIRTFGRTFTNLQELYESTEASNGVENEACMARVVLSSVNEQHIRTFGRTFTDALVSLCPEEKLRYKHSDTERKRERRKLLRQIRDRENAVLEKKATSTVYSENESLAGYNRKRKAMCFETPKAPKKERSHIGNLSNVTWNKDSVLADVSNWPNQTRINWSAIARKHSVPGRNGGQVVKELAKQSGLDVNGLDKRTSGTRVRRQKRKMIGGEISVPCPPTVQKVQQEREALIQRGEIAAGQPCAPYNLSRWVVNNGQLSQQEVQVFGRKVPLLSLRQKMLKQHESVMRLETDDQIAAKSQEQLVRFLEDTHTEYDTSAMTESLREKVKVIQRTRHLLLWHDHATLLGSGYILATLTILYDPGVFLTSAEHTATTGKNNISTNTRDLQQRIEEPQVYLIARGSSSVSDQLALIGDRVDCLHDLPTKLTASNGVEVTDHMRFFFGDKPAQNFERGTQMGGTFKCGSCGVRSCMVEDHAHSLRRPRRSLKELQDLVLLGTFGHTPNRSKPFEKLKCEEIKEELVARGVFDVDKPVKALRENLASLLEGAQRVPTLLVLAPSQSLASLNLQRYTILDCEPLHSLKGHLNNLFTELPKCLSGDLQQKFEELKASQLHKDKVTGADVRTLAILAFLLFREHSSTSDLVTLMDTIVRVSSILYLPDNQRTILQLYNTMWLHHEICTKLFRRTYNITREKLFGCYLHDLSSHAAQQYELVCLRSVNAECQERVFGQANQIALRATNRQANNIIREVLLRLQFKQCQGSLLDSVTANQSAVSAASTHMPPYTGTYITKTFIESRHHSWQAHLERISNYLILGEDIWWKKDREGYLFNDGDNDPNFRAPGPRLAHFRESTLERLAEEKVKKWEELVSREIPLPTTKITVYDEGGLPKDTISYSPLTNSSDPDQPTATLNSQNCSSGAATNTSYDSSPVSPVPDDSSSLDTSFHQLHCTPTVTSPTVPKCAVGNASASTPHRSTTSGSRQLQLNNATNTDEESDEDNNNLTVPITPSLGEDKEINTDIDTTETQDPINAHDSPILMSSLAKAIGKVLGTTDLVQHFDTLRLKMKSRTYTKSVHSEHAQALAQLQGLVLQERTSSLKKLEDLERRGTTQSSEYDTVLQHYQYAQKLLRTMKIDL